MKNVYTNRRSWPIEYDTNVPSQATRLLPVGWASKYTNSRKRSVNLYKSYQYIFVPCVKMVRMGRGWRLSRERKKKSSSSRANYTYAQLPSKTLYFHLIKVKDITLQHWAREFAPDLCNYCTSKLLLITIYNSLV